MQDTDGDQLVQPLNGQQLSSVTFVRDYIQLDFEGHLLNAVTLPTIRVGGRQYKPGETGYRDALCDRINVSVHRASLLEGDALLICFDDGAELSISLRAEDYTGPEAVVYSYGKKWWVK